MIVDSSALIAILVEEPGYGEPWSKLRDAPSAGIGTPTLAQTGIVLTSRLGVAGRTLLSRAVDELGLVPVPFGAEHWPVALDAYRRFGRGRHPAALNFGDCLTYAVARVAGEPLLCLGDDFAKTDLELA
ncbi:MAG: type II toxin-antitoxin system VapC family toxin [Gaiellales bacterium]